LILRKINSSAKWLSQEDGSWVPEGEIPADPLGDLPTDRGALSIWFVEDDESNLTRILCALAAKRDFLANFDYLLLDDRVTEELSLKVAQVPGDTADPEANACHRDIIELTATKLARLARAMYVAPRRRVSEKRVRNLLEEALRGKWLDPTKLKEKLANSLHSPGAT
jgi:hypothetical protein